MHWSSFDTADLPSDNAWWQAASVC